ncbi:hypothetical protein ACHAXM_001180, partial [Skeletonema potamos]
MEPRASQQSQSGGSDSDRLNVNLPPQEQEDPPPPPPRPPSVQFNLENTTIPQQNHEDEKEEDALSNTWYSRREIRSFQIQTLRSAQEIRELIQAGGGDGVRGEDTCVFGIELLSSSITARTNIAQIQQRVIQSVLDEQDRQEENNANDHILIALSSTVHSEALQ